MPLRRLDRLSRISARKSVVKSAAMDRIESSAFPGGDRSRSSDAVRDRAAERPEAGGHERGKSRNTSFSSTPSANSSKPMFAIGNLSSTLRIAVSMPGSAFTTSSRADPTGRSQPASRRGRCGGTERTSSIELMPARLSSGTMVRRPRRATMAAFVGGVRQTGS